MFGIMRDNALLETGNPRIVDDHIRNRMQSGQPLPVRLPLDIQNQRLTSQFIARSGQCLCIAIGQQHRRSFIDKSLGYGLANAASRASDNAKFS